MGKLVYSAITSVDGYVADADGSFDWAAPNDSLHAYFNDLERSIGTQLYGRRMYEVMKYWDTAGDTPDDPAVAHDFAAIWRASDKVVYSRTLDAVTTGRTRLERTFDPEAVRAMVSASDQDVSVGGPGLASVALRAGIVDEILLFAHPVLVGGGTAALPDGVRLDLELLDERQLEGGVVHARYRVRR